MRRTTHSWRPQRGKLGSKKQPGRLGSDSGVRRVFGFFDTHGRGALTPEDFRTGLRKYALLVFERKLWQELAAVLFPGGNELTMARFAELFMPSGAFTRQLLAQD